MNSAVWPTQIHWTVTFHEIATPQDPKLSVPTSVSELTRILEKYPVTEDSKLELAEP